MAEPGLVLNFEGTDFIRYPCWWAMKPGQETFIYREPYVLKN